MENTKRCPYCAEEINAAAIKCKFCGEVLDQKNFDQIHKESSPKVAAEPIKNTINPQNFAFALYTAIGVILLTFIVEIDFGDDYKWVNNRILLTSFITVITLYYCFRKYLRNFNANRAIALVNWNIAVMFMIGAWAFVAYVVGEHPGEFTTDQLMGMIAIMVVLLAINIIIGILLGVAIKRIENDFVGLLRELGNAFIYFATIGALIGIYAMFASNKFISVIGDVFDIIPIIIMARIFLRAYNENY